jgi:hypothetical protein
MVKLEVRNIAAHFFQKPQGNLANNNEILLLVNISAQNSRQSTSNKSAIVIEMVELIDSGGADGA